MAEIEENILFEVAKEFGIIPIAEESTYNKKLLIDKINYLLEHDFDRMISILYRMDVSEAKLKTSLEGNQGSDAANIIAALVIERQIEKINSRKNFKKDQNINEEDSW